MKAHSNSALLMRILAIVLMALVLSSPAWAQRKITPVNTKQTATQPYNEMEGDTARINARIRASMMHYHDENGNVIYIDTVTGREWRDSTAIEARKRRVMNYPLLESATIGVDIWNPIMRVFGQRYGLIDFMAQVSLYNRFKPTFQTGLGLASNTPPDLNFTYKSPLSWYFKIGMDYNFLYNSSTDYQFFAGARIGLSPFAYSLTDVTISSGYWGEDAHPQIPSQHATALWFELGAGLRVKLWGPISAGWMFYFHGLIHESKAPCGQPWYIPGFGARGGKLAGSMTITYTLPLAGKKPLPRIEGDKPEPTLYLQQDYAEPSPQQISSGLDAEEPL